MIHPYLKAKFNEVGNARRFRDHVNVGLLKYGIKRYRSHICTNKWLHRELSVKATIGYILSNVYGGDAGKLNSLFSKKHRHATLLGFRDRDLQDLPESFPQDIMAIMSAKEHS